MKISSSSLFGFLIIYFILQVSSNGKVRCGPGTMMTKSGKWGNVCRMCPSGTFSRGHKPTCRPCRLCHGQQVKTKCTAVQNTVCKHNSGSDWKLCNWYLEQNQTHLFLKHCSQSTLPLKRIGCTNMETCNLITLQEDSKFSAAKDIKYIIVTENDNNKDVEKAVKSNDDPGLQNRVFSPNLTMLGIILSGMIVVLLSVLIIVNFIQRSKHKTHLPGISESTNNNTAIGQHETNDSQPLLRMQRDTSERGAQRSSHLFESIYASVGDEHCELPPNRPPQPLPLCSATCKKEINQPDYYGMTSCSSRCQSTRSDGECAPSYFLSSYSSEPNSFYSRFLNQRFQFSEEIDSLYIPLEYSDELSPTQNFRRAFEIGERKRIKLKELKYLPNGRQIPVDTRSNPDASIWAEEMVPWLENQSQNETAFVEDEGYWTRKPERSKAFKWVPTGQLPIEICHPDLASDENVLQKDSMLCLQQCSNLDLQSPVKTCLAETYAHRYVIPTTEFVELEESGPEDDSLDTGCNHDRDVRAGLDYVMTSELQSDYGVRMQTRKQMRQRSLREKQLRRTSKHRGDCSTDSEPSCRYERSATHEPLKENLMWGERLVLPKGHTAGNSTVSETDEEDAYHHVYKSERGTSRILRLHHLYTLQMELHNVRITAVHMMNAHR